MKNIKQYILIVMTCLLAVNASFAQEIPGAMKRADKLYDAMAYPAAIRLYERVLKRNDIQAAREKCADAALKIGDTEKAEKWFGAAAQAPGSAAINKFRYAKTLKTNGKYDEARKWFQAYADTGEDREKAMRYLNSIDMAMGIKMDSAQYKIKDTPYNSKESDIAAVPFGTGIIYASTQKKGSFSRRINLRDEGLFYDMYESATTPGKDKAKTKPLKGDVNSKFHDGPGTLTANGNLLYFTRSHYVTQETGRKSILKIYSAEKVENKWKNVTAMPFNSETYSVGHPAISRDGRKMVFSSDMPGGMGGTDLYVVTKTGDTWSKPRNLGPSVNTDGNEMFPWLSPENVLIFASDGHMGLGGHDIFFASPAGENDWKDVRNGGYPLNSTKDDFGLSFIPGRPMGYFSSDRAGGKGDDDIYMFSRKTLIEGTVVDNRTKKPIQGVKINMVDASGQTTELTTDADGKFRYYGDWKREYQVAGSKATYIPFKQLLSTGDISPVEDLKVTMEMELESLFNLMGTVSDAESGKPLDGVTYRIYKRPKKMDYNAESDGTFFSKLGREERDYTVVFFRDGYVPFVYDFSTIGLTEPRDFKVNPKLEKGTYQVVLGKVVSKATGQPIEGARVAAISVDEGKEVTAVRSRRNGEFSLVVSPSEKYYIVVSSKQNYFTSRLDLPEMKANQDTLLDVTIEMVRYRVGEVSHIIYYDYNKSDIRRDASAELYELVYFLLDNPEASVELSSHTDSRGGNSYNQKLSQRRADAAVDFIISKGIDKERISSKGYGETRLTNKCRDGVNCSEEDHSLNRRSEMTITGIEGVDIPSGGKIDIKGKVDGGKTGGNKLDVKEESKKLDIKEK